MPEFLVKQGDCINSIAFEYGFFPEKIWEDARNKTLKEHRKNQNILLAGDKVFIPEKEQKIVALKTDKRNRVKMKGVPARLLIKFIDNEGEIMSNEPFKLEVDGNIVEGNLTTDGMLDVSIMPNSKKAVVIFDSEFYNFKYEFMLGYLNPIDTLSGIKARLNGLGFDCGESNEEFNILTEMSIKAFKKKYQLEPQDGKIDSIFIGKLRNIFGQ